MGSRPVSPDASPNPGPDPDGGGAHTVTTVLASHDPSSGAYWSAEQCSHCGSTLTTRRHLPSGGQLAS